MDACKGRSHADPNDKLARREFVRVLRLASGRQARGQSQALRPDGVFGQINRMRAGDGEVRAMSTCVGFLPQVEHVSRSITSAIC
jgi:hypothetical protein